MFRFERAKGESFWALDDVSFSINPGEAVGIIGRNGAGKSTLLKILSRITAPTRGEVRLRGRIAALLEVGTGFHPELTGRENIYLNGAIMGMTRDEIERSFDEIVAFAEVEKFLDTPVKRYSSGMYVRLAFAVAAHLAARDPGRRRGARGRRRLVPEEVPRQDAGRRLGRAHGAVRQPQHGGDHAAVLARDPARDGKVAADGRVDKVVTEYIRGASGDSPVAVDFEASGRMPGNEHARLLGARVVSPDMKLAVVDIRRPYASRSTTRCCSEHWPLHPDRPCLQRGRHVRVHHQRLISSAKPPAATTRSLPCGRRGPRQHVRRGHVLGRRRVSTMDPVIVHFWERGALAFQVHDPGGGDTLAGNVRR